MVLIEVFMSVVGVQDTTLSQQLQLDTGLTLETVKKKYGKEKQLAKGTNYLTGEKKSQSVYKSFRNLTIGREDRHQMQKNVAEE